MRAKGGGLCLQAIILLLAGLLSNPAQADDVYRSGRYAFHVPLELAAAQLKVVSIIRGSFDGDFQRWAAPPCHRLMGSTRSDDGPTPTRLFKMFKERADVAIAACATVNAPGITFVFVDGGLDAATAKEASRMRAMMNPAETVGMIGQSLDGACNWLSVTQRSDGSMIDGTILLNVALDSTRQNACLYSLTVRLLGLSDEEYHFSETPSGAEQASLEVDLLSLFVLYHADALEPEETSDRTIQIKRVVTHMYLEGDSP
jgi:hypothetical protein